MNNKFSVIIRFNENAINHANTNFIANKLYKIQTELVNNKIKIDNILLHNDFYLVYTKEKHVTFILVTEKDQIDLLQFFYNLDHEMYFDIINIKRTTEDDIYENKTNIVPKIKKSQNFIPSLVAPFFHQRAYC